MYNGRWYTQAGVAYVHCYSRYEQAAIASSAQVLKESAAEPNEMK